MESGLVKFFNNEKGYGFLASDDGKEVFVHITGCVDQVKKGDRVSFDITEGKRGDNATNVKLLQE